LIAGLAQSTLALPALRSLRKHFPKSRISIVSSLAAADLFKLAGCADEILTVGRLERAEILKPAALYRSAIVWGKLRKNHYDLAIEFKRNAESAMVMQLANPLSRLTRAGPLNRNLGDLIDRVSRLLLQKPPAMIHAAHEYLKILEPLGVRPVESAPRLATDRAADETIEKLLHKHGAGFGEILVGVHAGADPGRQPWPIERFASIAARMIHNFNARIVVLDGPGERGPAKKLAGMLPAKRAIAIVSPKLAELVSASARLSLLISNMSAAAHVAAAAGTPVVVVSANPAASSEDLLGGRCEHIRGSHIDLISEEAVYEAACRLLKMSRAEFLSSR
jgi:ADP-heptose:LPS heptosyltransferase